MRSMRHEHLASADPRLQADDRRKLVAPVEPGDDVLDPAEPLAG